MVIGDNFRGQGEPQRDRQPQFLHHGGQRRHVSRRSASPPGRRQCVRSTGNGRLPSSAYDTEPARDINALRSNQGSGGLAFNDYAGLAFGPDGNLYVASASTSQVLEYNGSTGAYPPGLSSAGSGGLSHPRGLTFGPDGSLYVSSCASNSILRYQGPQGSSPAYRCPPRAIRGDASSTASGGLSTCQPRSLLWPRRKSLRRWRSSGVLRYQRHDGRFHGQLHHGRPWRPRTAASGRGMAFDQEGRLYVSDAGDAVLRYDAQGNFLGDLLVNAVNPGLSKPLGICFDVQGNLLYQLPGLKRCRGDDRGVAVTLSSPCAMPVSVNYTTAGRHRSGGNQLLCPFRHGRLLGPDVTRDPVGHPGRHPGDGNVAFLVQLSNPPAGPRLPPAPNRQRDR